MSPPRQGRKSLYKSKCSDHELILVKNERLKNLAVDKSSNEESESQNLSFQLAALQSSHTTLQESHATLQRSHSDCQELVKTYENHIDGITATNEAQRQHYNNAILNMNSEMARMQRDFNDHLPTNNPDWYKTSALQESIIRLRRETIQSRRVNEELNSRLERTVAEYQEVVDLLSNQQKYHYYHPNTNIITTKPGKQARFESIEEEEERKRKLAAVEEQQKRIRRDDEALEALIERARKWKLGKHYPPERKGWQEQVEKSAWERWEGMTWLEEASEEDRNEAVRLGLWVP
ncbi:hypothetical protein B0J11DRAFT_540772 [Dendryphion nanum]|uniref:Uncharacterized protein n=1 Tax=Dendryphion nanum TaxID=256645 RepID=A0A9P9D8E4_9PLEO|nr:hypothetical protein B0J11DRAFT_540772 [Dendryphion nanum]